jgi:hypothetical protein
MGNSDYPQIKRVHGENAERMILSSLISGLQGFPRRQFRFSNPQDIDQALNIALTVQEAESQERFNESSYTLFDKLVRMCSRSPGRSRSENEVQRQPTDSRTESHTRVQLYSKPSSAGRSDTSRSRNTQTQEALRCYECHGFGHFAVECTTRPKRGTGIPDSPGIKNQTERSKHSRPPRGKPPRETTIWEANVSGNVVEA